MVILIILSTVFGILSCRRLISSGFVIPCMNPEILMISGAPFTSLLSTLNLRTKSSVDSLSLDACRLRLMLLPEGTRQVIVAVYGFGREIVKPYPGRSDECGVEHVVPCWHCPTFHFCCRLKDLEVIFPIPTSVICFNVTWYMGPLREIKIADAGSKRISFLVYPWLG
ncbi:hypothetical protein Tco_1064117 [Tanacetum coccineum]